MSWSSTATDLQIHVSVPPITILLLCLAKKAPHIQTWRAYVTCVQAMVSQVRHDHSLLHERVLRLTGPEGVARLDAALQAVREEVEAEMDEAASEASWESASEGVRWVWVRQHSAVRGV